MWDSYNVNYIYSGGDGEPLYVVVVWRQYNVYVIICNEQKKHAHRSK